MAFGALKRVSVGTHRMRQTYASPLLLVPNHTSLLLRLPILLILRKTLSRAKG